MVLKCSINGKKDIKASHGRVNCKELKNMVTTEVVPISWIKSMDIKQEIVIPIINKAIMTYANVPVFYHFHN